MRMTGFLNFIDTLSTWVGKSFGWLILILTFGISYEVFMRYALSAPTTWAFDFSYILYGGLFFMSGAYTLSRGGHVRADMFSRLWPVRVQASIELSLYILFFFPGILSMSIAGWHYAHDAFRIKEMSINSPIGIPIWQIKMLIPVGGALVALQGVAEVLRCLLCLKQGHWEPRLHDVEELEKQILEKAATEGIEAAKAITR